MGWGLVLLLIFYIYFSIKWARQAPTEFDKIAVGHSDPIYKQVIMLFIGIFIVILSSKVLIPTVEISAFRVGIPQSVIAATLVAFGTSLPELAACVASALKRHHDIAIGNVIGSNLFNLLAVLPIPGLLAPGPSDPAAAGRDYPVMLLLTLALGMLLLWQRRGRIGRLPGALLLAGYLGYLGWVASTSLGVAS